MCNELFMQCAGDLAESSWAWTLQMPEKTVHHRDTRMPDLAAIRGQVEAEPSVDRRLRGFTLTWQMRNPLAAEEPACCSSTAEVSTEADGGELYLECKRRAVKPLVVVRVAFPTMLALAGYDAELLANEDICAGFCGAPMDATGARHLLFHVTINGTRSFTTFSSTEASSVALAGALS